MIPNCYGCKYELEEAYSMQQKGLHLATCVDKPYSYPNIRSHFFLLMVDDKGRLMVW